MKTKISDKRDQIKLKRDALVNLRKLHKKMKEDLVDWSVRYNDSGVIELLKDDETFSIEEVRDGKVSLYDVAYQIEYIEKYYEKS